MIKRKECILCCFVFRIVEKKGRERKKEKENKRVYKKKLRYKEREREI